MTAGPTGVWAVVPVRSLAGGKTRLANDVSPTDRQALTTRMLRHVLRVVDASGVAERIIVVSADDDALNAAGTAVSSVVPILQREDRPGLNAALDLGREVALRNGASSVLVLFADLPLLAVEDLHALVEVSAAHDVAIAADRHGEGTNALLLDVTSAGKLFAFQFGSQSAPAHRREAARLGMRLGECHSVGLAFDLDTAQDLAHYAEQTKSMSPGDR